MRKQLQKTSNMNPEPQTYPKTSLEFTEGVIAGVKLGLKLAKPPDENLLDAQMQKAWNIVREWTKKTTEPQPEKKKVPMTADDFPAHFYLRFNGSEDWFLPEKINRNGIKWDETFFTYSSLLFNKIEYSTDRKEAKGCWKYE